MTTLVLEGFDELTNDNATFTAELAGVGFSNIVGFNAIERTTPRFTDGYSPAYMRPGAVNRGIAYGLSNLSTVVAGCATYLPNAVTARTLLAFRDGTTTQVDVRVDATGKLLVTRNGTQIGSTGTSTILTQTWYYIEFKVTIHDSAGSFEVRLNGATEISGSGLDTKNTANAYATDVFFGGNNADYYDDLYVDDADFLGPIRVVTLFPSGNGTSSDLVGSDGNSTDNYALVDDTMTEGFANGDTDYVESSVVGDHDTYAMANLPTSASAIKAIENRIAAKASDAGARSARIVTRSGATDYESGTFVLTSSYVYYSDLRAVDPATGVAWTEAGVDAIEVGAKVQA